jgi:hypothetical protein
MSNLNAISKTKAFTLVSRKQVDKQAANTQTVMASVYRTPKRNGFDYAVSVTRSERNADGVMADVESLSVDAARIDSLIQELLAAKEAIKADMAALAK